MSTQLKKDLIKAALFTPYSRDRWGLPVLAWSEPGAAKTAVIEEVCEEWEIPCITLSPGEQGEGAFGVVPVPVTIDGITVLTHPAPEWAIPFLGNAAGCVFVDETNTAPPALQPALLGLFLARRIGGAKLGPRVRVLAAANPPEVAATGYDLSPPAANRMGHIDWAPPSVEEHAEYMMRGSTAHSGKGVDTRDADQEEKRVLVHWPEAWARAVGLETAFLRRKSHLKNKCPKAGDPQSGKAWPSDRSWENATRALASAEVHGLSDNQRAEFVAAFIGAGPALEWETFRRDADLPDPADLLDGRTRFTHASTRLDRTFAVLSACTALVTPKEAKKRDDRALALWEIMAEVIADKGATDVCVPAAQAMIRAQLFGPKYKSSAKPMATLAPLLRSAGLVQ